MSEARRLYKTIEGKTHLTKLKVKPIL